MTIGRNPWIAFRRAADRATVRLFCLPCAGAGAMMYRGLAAHLPHWIDVCPVELPGRGMRSAESGLENWAELSAAIARGLEADTDLPFAFFGHSMGAILSFEVARAAVRDWGASPELLVVSGMRAAHLPDAHEPMSALSDQRLLARVRALGGVPEPVWRDAALCQMMLPILRTDFRVCDSYQFRPGTPLACPVIALAGADDPLASPTQVRAWEQHTTGVFRCHVLPGGHFFLHDHLSTLAAEITTKLAGTTRTPQPTYV